MFSLLYFLPSATAAFIGCFSKITGGSVATPLFHPCRSQCNQDLSGKGVKYYGTNGYYPGPLETGEVCYCTHEFPGAANLQTCNDDNWRVHQLSQNYYTWGCLDEGTLYESWMAQYATPHECFQLCEGQGTKWAIMQNNNKNGYYCTCEADIPSGEVSTDCHRNSFYLYTSTD